MTSFKPIAVLAAFGWLTAPPALAGEPAAVNQPETETQQNQLNKSDNPQPKSSQTGYYKEAGSYGTRRMTEPPEYARTLSKTGIEAVKDIDWLDVGLDFRFRYERRDDDIRRPQGGLDEPLLLRTRAYLKIHDIFDPFRFAVEFEDARRYNSEYVLDDRDVNEFELIQTYAELYLKDALGSDDLGQGRPFSLKAGRLAFEFLDRRLIGKNEWRNTTNTFQGFQVTLGEERNDWQVDLLALQPLQRLKYEIDKPNEEIWFYAAIGHWRKWSDIVTLEPHYLGLKQSGKEGRINRDIHSPGIRLYGFVPGTGFNYDASAIYQFGRNGLEQHDAYAFTAEIGYTFDHSWKPRLSAFYGYASGDRDPNDNKNNRFERFFGFARPWAADDYIVFENLSIPKVKLEFQPIKDLRIDTGYSWFWLASDKDRFNNLGNVPGPNNFNRDRTGKSGDSMGHGFDIRARYKINAHLDANIGYAYFTTGEFVRNRQKAGRGSSDDDSDFFYVELSANLFE